MFLLCVLVWVWMMLVFFVVIRVILNLWKKLFSVENDLLCFLWILSENIMWCLFLKLNEMRVWVIVGFI